jgi:hypothetical protein
MKKAQNFEMVAGDTVNLHVGVTENSASKNLNGATIKWVLYDEVNESVVLTKTTVAGVTITNVLGGQFTVALTPTDTVNVAPGRYYHESEVTDETGNVSTIFTGHVTILATRI